MITDLPNVLTLSRIAAIPVLIVLASLRLPAGDLAACIVFAAAGVTDYLDGKLARSRKQFSDLGRIADKLLVGAILIMLAGDGRLGPWGLYPAIIIMLREILVSGLREFLAEIRVGLPVTRLAKWKTTAQMGALGFLIAGDPTARLLHLPWLHAWLMGLSRCGPAPCGHRLAKPARGEAGRSGEQDQPFLMAGSLAWHEEESVPNAKLATVARQVRCGLRIHKAHLNHMFTSAASDS
jgi:cardiolipin synthase